MENFGLHVLVAALGGYGYGGTAGRPLLLIFFQRN